MKGRAAVINWILFSVFTLLTVVFVKWWTAELWLINETAAMILFCLGFPLKIYRLQWGQYIILFLLIVLLFQPFSYSYTVVDGNTTSTYNSGYFVGKIDPVIFVVLMSFIAFNHEAVIHLYRLFTKGSKGEREDKRIRDINFYYKKFGTCSDSELEDIYNMYGEYPVEAQEALIRLKSEKNSTKGTE